MKEFFINTINNFKKYVKTLILIVSLPLAVQSFVFKQPYYIIIGIWFIEIFILLFPYLDKLTKKMGFEFTVLEKVFIIITSIFAASALISLKETNYLKIILPIIVMILIFIGTSIYSILKEKKKNKKSKKTRKKEK